MNLTLSFSYLKRNTFLLFCFSAFLLFSMFSLLAVVILLARCSHNNLNTNELINEVIIRNNTSSILQDVVLNVPKKNIVLSTNAILAYRDYALGFPEVVNKREYAILKWSYNGKRYSREIKTIILDGMNKHVAAKVIIRIDDTGNIRSILEAYE